MKACREIALFFGIMTVLLLCADAILLGFWPEQQYMCEELSEYIMITTGVTITICVLLLVVSEFLESYKNKTDKYGER